VLASLAASSLALLALGAALCSHPSLLPPWPPRSSPGVLASIMTLKAAADLATPAARRVAVLADLVAMFGSEASNIIDYRRVLLCYWQLTAT